MDLDLDLAGAIGRKARPLHAEVVRELTDSDLALLATERGIQPTQLQRITDRHHALARCLASGMSVTEACLVTGYTPSRVSILRGDPSFEELIEFYRGGRAAEVLDFQAHATALAKDSIIELAERLELNPTSFSNSELHDQVKLTSDRTGNGPKSTTVNVNVNLGERMKAARERAQRAPAPSPPLVIDGTFSEVKS